MKTSTRLLCLMLALLLCLCVFFVACNNEPDPEPTPTPDDGGTVTPEPEPEPEEPADPTDQKKGELHPTGYTGEGAQIQEPNQEVSGDETLRS